MKLYLLNGIYYEKQADVPKGQGSFAVVEFPFSASPKADFVAWMNDNHGAAGTPPNEVHPEPDAPLLVDQRVREQAEKPKQAPREFFNEQHPLTTMAIEDWCAAAQPHQLGTVVRAASLRLQEVSQEVAR